MLSDVVRCGEDFPYVFKGTPYGRAKRPASARPSAWARGSPEKKRGLSGRPAVVAGVEGVLAAGRRQPGPLPLARQRTGAGRCRHAVSPAPARRRSPPSRTRWPRPQEQPGGPPAPGNPVAAKAPSQGRYGLQPPRPLLCRGRPL